MLGPISQSYADKLHGAHQHRVLLPREFAIVHVGIMGDGKQTAAYQIFEQDAETLAFELLHEPWNAPATLEVVQDRLESMSSCVTRA